MPGEPDDPHWQRVMGVNVLNTLQHTGPAFVHAPTLATVKSWSALRIILEEATEMDDICCQRIDPQDLNTPLHLPGPHGTGTGADNEHEEAEEEQPEGEEEEAAEDESSPDGHHDDDAPGAPDDPDDSTGPSATGLTTTLVDSGSGDSGGATGLDILDPTDPLNHAGSGTTMTAALPSSVMPGDMIYEVDDVSFNLSAASRCLLSTRQEVARMRAGNRHSRPNGADERSRSRTPPRGSGDAARRDLGKNCPDLHYLSTTPAWSRLSGDKLSLPLRHRCQVVQSARRPDALPQHDRKRSLAVSVCTALVDASQPTASMPSSKSIDLRLLYSQPCRYTCAVALKPALQAWLMLAVWFTLLVRPLFQLLSTVCPRQRKPCSSASQCASLVSTSDCDLALLPQSAVSNTPWSPGAQALPQASPTVHSTSRLGPNSQGPLALHMRMLILLICLQPSCAGVWTEARVATHAAEVAGGANPVTSYLLASALKPGGFPTKNRPMLNVCYTRSAKRAYQRACNRAVQQGQTRYRGRLLTSAQIPEARRRGLPVNTSNIPARKPNHPPAGGVQLFTWNSGGLGGGLYDELLTYLTNSRVDIAVVQESKWTACMEYTSGPWTCVHTGCKSRKQAGVLVMVHTRLALPSQIRFEHLVKGRLIHVRVPLKTSDHRHLHVLGVYQKTHENNDKTTPQQRQQIWQAIHKCLGQLPVRDSVVLIGDLNTPLRPMEPWVGKEVGARPANPPDDVAELETILQAHSLVALNTWYPASGGSHTFSWGKARTQIDFVFAKQGDAATIARQVKPLHRFHVGAARQGGAYHIPLQCLLPTGRPHWIRSGPKPPPSVDQEALLAALDQPTEQTNLCKIALVRQAVSAHISAQQSLDGIQSLHAVLYQACCKVFPRAPAQPRRVPWQTDQVQAGVKDMWQRWRAFKQVRKQGLRGWFQAWKAWKAFDVCYREHQRRCKAARRAVLLDAMQEAEGHAARHNARGIYQIIKRIAPKQDRRRMQLRGEGGTMLLPQEELQLLQEHFQHRFAAQDEEDQQLMQRAWSGTGGLKLDAYDLCRAIQAVPRRKAVPYRHPPSAAWKLCADLISPWLVTTLSNPSPAIQVPRCWTDVDLALVPKPEKSGRLPKDYRPIGLARPLGKKVLGQLVQPYIPSILQHIRLFPQYAYQQGRSQYDALRRVFAHCAAVRHQLRQHTRNLHLRYQGHKPVPLFGALMLTVDLTQAFDRMPRSKLYAGMCRLDLPQDLIHTLMAWHAEIRYTIRHADDQRTFRASQGIRQGCSVAPLLWLIFSHEVSCALEAKVGRDMIIRTLTIFADDYHMADAFTSLAAFEHLLDVVAVLFHVLTAFGMEVSAGKSKAILALRGTLSNTIRKKYVRPAPDGSGQVLRIQSRHQAFCIPLVSQFTYLGTQVSYSCFEQQTLTSRLAKGETCYHRLGAVLKGRHHLTQAQRLHLWKS